MSRELMIQELVAIKSVEDDIERRIERMQECGPWREESVTTLEANLQHIRADREFLIVLMRHKYGSDGAFDMARDAASLLYG